MSEGRGKKKGAEKPNERGAFLLLGAGVYQEERDIITGS